MCYGHTHKYLKNPKAGSKGGCALLMSSPLSGISGLSFDSIFLSAPLLFCLVLFILSSPCFCFWPSLLPAFQKCMYTFFFSSRDRLFCIALIFRWVFFSSCKIISWLVVSAACYLIYIIALVLAINCMHLRI